MNKKTNIGLLLLVFAIGIGTITSFALAGYKADQEMAGLTYVLPPTTTGRVAGVAVERAVVNIYRGTNTTLSAQVVVPEDGTVLDALRAAADAYSLTLDIDTSSSYGAFVNGIGDLIGGQDSQYWLYYVNGQSGMVAVDKQIVNSGDKIDFKFEKSTF
jgi:hypothetical protein